MAKQKITTQRNKNSVEKEYARNQRNFGKGFLKDVTVGFAYSQFAIYAVLIQGIATGGNPIGAIWGCMGYSVLLCFCLFKTGSIARSVFSAH